MPKKPVDTRPRFSEHLPAIRANAQIDPIWEDSDEYGVSRALAGACAVAALTAGAFRPDQADHRHREQRRHDPHAGLTDDFTTKNPDITLEWVTLEENVLRQRVTTDIATKGGQFDVLTIGTYEVPIWAKQGWLVPLENLGADYDVDDLLPAIRAGLTYEGKLYAAPFYGESSMIMYRKDLFEKAGITMPESPTWEFVADAARKLTDKSSRDLRHLPARQGRLGREHGLPHRHVELLRRALVRRELEAAVRPAGRGRRRSTSTSS